MTAVGDDEHSIPRSLPNNENTYHGFKGVGKGGRGVTEFKFMLLCVHAVTAKGHQNVEKQERKKNSFQVISSVTHTKIKA